MTTSTPTKPKRACRFARMPKADTLASSEAGFAPMNHGATSTPEAPPPPAASSKIAQVITLLQRPGGARLDEIIAITGWLPHTTRAALTGLRKKGHTVERAKRDGVTCYSIPALA